MRQPLWGPWAKWSIWAVECGKGVARQLFKWTGKCVSKNGKIM